MLELDDFLSFDYNILSNSSLFAYFFKVIRACIHGILASYDPGRK